MKKRFPVFSALLFVYAVLSLYDKGSNVLRYISMVPNPGTYISSFLPTLAQIGLMVALAVMAILVTEKPDLAKPAGYLAVIWGAWTGVSFLKSLVSQFTMGLDAFGLISNLCSGIITVIVAISWILVAVNMISGKPAKKSALSSTKIILIAFLFVLLNGVRSAFSGNANVVAILVNALIAAIPMLMAYFASQLLEVTFNEPEKAPVVNKNSLKSIVVYVVVIAVALCLFYSCGSSRGGGQRGDGVNTCRNCGRKTDLVAGFGFCGICYEGFNDWQKTSWRD